MVRTGRDGALEIQQMMRDFRSNAPKTLGGSPVVTVKDYDSLTCTDLRSGKAEKLDFPTTSNVLQFFTEDGSKVSIRPSGTEPKIKFYLEVRGTLADRNDWDRANADADAKLEALKHDLGI